MTEGAVPPEREGSATARGGRREIAYREFGPPDGPVVLYFHGTPSSSLDVHMFNGAAVAGALGARLIAIDRPGCGRSTFQPGRRLADWPIDILDLTTHLSISRCSVLGWSGGGPYALACARRLPELIRACAVVSSVAPLSVPGYARAMSRSSHTYFRLNRSMPPLGRMLNRLMLLGSRKDPAQFLRRSAASLPAVDRSVLDDPAVAAAYLAAVIDCFRSGTRGGALDAALAAGSWRIDLEGTSVPVHIWHGGHDADAPQAAAAWIHDAVPASTLHILPEEGHLSLIATRFPAILEALLADGTSSSSPSPS